MLRRKKEQNTGAGPEILKRCGALCRRKDQNNVRNYKFLAKYLYQHFKLFSIFIYNESSPMKSYQFFKIYKRFGKERDKTLMHQSMRKEKLRKAGLCFIKSCFIKS